MCRSPFARHRFPPEIIRLSVVANLRMKRLHVFTSTVGTADGCPELNIASRLVPPVRAGGGGSFLPGPDVRSRGRASRQPAVHRVVVPARSAAGVDGIAGRERA